VSAARPPPPAVPLALQGALGPVVVVAVMAVWGVNWPMMKLAVAEIPPWSFRVASVYAAGLTLLLIAALRGERLRLAPSRIVPLLGVGMFAVTGWHMLTAYGVMMMGSGRAAIIAFTMPVWAALLGAVVLKERVDRRRGAALALGTAGMALLIATDIARVGAAPFGAFLILAAAVAWAVGIVLTRAVDWGIGTIALTGWQLVIGGLPILLLWPLIEGVPDLAGVTWRAWGALGFVTFVALVFCYTAHVQIVRTLPAALAALSTLVIPIAGVASSALLLGEPVGWPELAALVFVLASMRLVLVPAPRRAPA
jgi:drug/metabolite transporter (DMT)-like permease